MQPVTCHEEVPCASSLQPDGTYDGVPCASSYVPSPGSLNYNNDPIPRSWLMDYDIQQHETAQCDRHSLQAPPPVDSLSETVAAFHLHSVVPVRGMIHLTGLSDQSTMLTAALADTGANCCLCKDESKLVDVHSITPVPIGVATTPKQATDVTYCDKMGFLPLPRTDGEIHMQPCYCTPLASSDIMSPESIMAHSQDIAQWVQRGYKSDNEPGTLDFLDKDGKIVLTLTLHKQHGLYYSWMDTYATDSNPIRIHTVVNANPTTSTSARPSVSPPHLIEDVDDEDDDDDDDDTSINDNDPDDSSVITNDSDDPLEDSHDSTSNPIPTRPTLAPTHKVAGRRHKQQKPRPVRPEDHLLAELWAARFGHCEESQLHVLPKNATGLPPTFRAHPLRFIDHKVRATIRKCRSRKVATKATKPGQCFYVDFGFMRASTSDYSRPTPTTDRVVTSIDGFNSYLLVVDKFSRYMWIFLCKSKEPPIDEMSAFLSTFGLQEGGVIRCDQGGELAGSEEFITSMLKHHNYKVEPTGADSPSQNGGVERFNQTIGATTRSLLYGSSLPAEFWSFAVVHAVYLHNRLVHSRTKQTPYEALTSKQPDVRHLRVFGSRVCVKRTGERRSKLDRHDFSGIFLGFTATDQNIIYYDLDTARIKRSHHAFFDESWYMQQSRPPAAQLLYDCGIVYGDNVPSSADSTNINQHPQHAPYPHLHSTTVPSINITPAIQQPLPLRLGPTPQPALDKPTTPTIDPFADTVLASFNPDGQAVTDYRITARDFAQVYVSPHAYHNGFEVDVDLKYAKYLNHPSWGLKFRTINGRLILEHIEKSTIASKIPRWRSTLKGAWLRQINSTIINTLQDVHQAVAAIEMSGDKSCVLTFSHPEIQHGLSNDGIPQVNIDQLNPKNLLTGFTVPDLPMERQAGTVRLDGGVYNFESLAMRLTRGKLKTAPDWSEWQQSEGVMLDQYEEQGLFGEPVPAKDKDAIFNLVWTYVVKELDKRKKARCTCDGSTRGGQVRVLDYTYANCVDQTSSRIFYAVAAAENLLVYGADVANAFGEAPSPKQGFYIRPDKAFIDWWASKGRPPIPPGYVIPVLKAMQGHPESPRLWERHVDKIIRDIGFTPTTHEPCLYSGIIGGQRVLFMRQVDDFAIAAPSESIANIVFDMIDDKLTFPLKRMGLVTLFNGMDVTQTADYIKLSCSTYIDKIMPKHLTAWMSDHDISTRPTPLPSNKTFMTSFLNSKGDPDPAAQSKLSKEMKISYRSAIGELIYAMTTCRPDIAYATVRAAQYSTSPAAIHYHGVRHILKYLHATKDDGLYYWRTSPNNALPSIPPPAIRSHHHDLLLDGRPTHTPTELHGFVDSDWAACPQTRRSFAGTCLRLAGSCVGYKAHLMPTVSQSSTEGEFMAACSAGRMILFVRSILWDLGIPQAAATLLYEDNDACIAMANAQKPTTRTRHMDIKYNVLCEWVERDLILLRRADTTINMADHFTKQLGPTLFQRHVDYIMGHVPPHYTVHFQRLLNVPPLTAPDHTGLPTLAAKLCQIWEQTTHHLTSTLFNPILHEISNCGGVS